MLHYSHCGKKCTTNILLRSLLSSSLCIFLVVSCPCLTDAHLSSLLYHSLFPPPCCYWLFHLHIFLVFPCQFDSRESFLIHFALDDTCHLLDDIIPLLLELYILFVIHLLCNGIRPCLVKFDGSVSLLIFTYLTWWLIPLTRWIRFSCISLLEGIHPLLFKFDCRALPYSSFTFIFFCDDICPHLVEFECLYLSSFTSSTLISILSSSNLIVM